MASPNENEYDELLESFMNNFSDAYDEDRKAQLEREGFEHQAKSTVDKSSRFSRNKRGRKLEKKMRKNGGAGQNGVKVLPLPLRILLGCAIVVAFVGIVCVSVAGVYGYTVVHGDPVFDLDEEKYSQNQTSFIYGTDSSGEQVEITRLHGEQNRIWVDMEDMSPYMRSAFIALEDKRFEKHHGVDWFRTVSALIIHRATQGGSTITQQLVKNLTGENQATFVRKFNEILSALNLEKNYSKDDIIEAYMNTVYLSNGCYGVKTAAERYFGKDISELNIAECACLASITQKPYLYDPLKHPEDNRVRAEYCMLQMLKEGFITQEEYDEAMAYEMVYTNSANYQGSTVEEEEEEETQQINSYYTDFVIDEVLADLQKMGYSERTARNMLYGGGLRIYTAIDFDLQEIVEDVYENYRRMPDETVQGAMVIMDYSGRVCAIVGGTGEKTGNRTLNRASQSERQPGSALKPLSVYSPALEKTKSDDSVGVYWSTMQKDSPLRQIDGKWWPKNEGGSYSRSNVTLQSGIARSLNTISAHTLDRIGTDYAINFLKERYHFTTLNDVNDNDWAPMATGALDTGASVLEMTAAYAAFGNGGYYYEPYAYYRIEDSQGNVLIEKDPEATKQRAISEGTAGVMNKILQTVMTASNGTGRWYKIDGVECFGKTGTTTDDKDRWFVGGTPDYVSAVWYGYDQPKEVVYNLSPNPCGTIWNYVFKQIYNNNSGLDSEFAENDSIVERQYCTRTGLLASSSCPKATGWYDKESLPGYCSGHGSSGGSSDDDAEENDADAGETTAPADTTAAADAAPDAGGEE